MVKNLSCVSYGSLKRFPHAFTSVHPEAKHGGFAIKIDQMSRLQGKPSSDFLQKIMLKHNT